MGLLAYEALLFAGLAAAVAAGAPLIAALCGGRDRREA